ncbi:ABC transporter permease [Aureimonas phyllosphaerae]|uniref:Simple sugar transport system permease protein n=1 Tax=Aureimonas phyllosphaerae TaxID=1166078 RepID=A0A7W6BX89_9HYPH|nr:ABC transporter permease [Aureimonas phyllosphaerae]MBB3936370.1 simple sugar transport system permease protein [Aureimonas phyllosphaerae]MBB3960766.1 simple sugar transport system permease protein [Aureimonas phyllosphaerae]SFF31428.1 nucleoside ABC transporter membrane protein [Aureimonas phyllosphaerae]
MSPELIVAIVVAVVASATPILIAALGELVVEKSGVLNLGVEGMMLIGAVTGFAVSVTVGSPWLGAVAALVAGAASSLIFAWLTLTLTANQVATGLALTIFGTGVSALAGAGFVGITTPVLDSFFPAALAADPIWRVLFGYSPIVYLSLVLTFAVWWFLKHSRAGLILRAVGESDASAHSIGYPVLKVRYLAVLFGGAMAGLAGAYYSLVLTPMWAERLTAGRGWIAIALVVFASWRPGRLLLGAYLFGAVITLELQAKAAGWSLLAPEFLTSLPYLATVLVLALISGSARTRNAAPACLGKPFRATA